jgi:hypothetical protein
MATVKPSKDQELLIGLDEHPTNTSELGRENGVLLLSVPAHMTHRQQTAGYQFTEARINVLVSSV